MSSPTVRRNRLVIVAVALVVALIAVLVGGELYTRHRIKDCMTAQFQQQLGSKVDVGLGFKPVLIEMLDQRIPSLTLNSADNKFGPAIGMKVHAEVNDIRLEDNGKRAGTVGSSSADVIWSADGIAETLRSRLAGAVTGVKANPSDNTIEIDGILGSQFTLQPQVTDGKVAVKTEQASVLGFGLPTDLVDSVVKLVTNGLQQTFPIGLMVKSVHVTGEGVHLSLTGGKYDLPRPEQPVNCNVL